MKKGTKALKGILASVLAATIMLGGAGVNSITAKAATKVDIAETTQAIGKRGTLIYKETGNSVVTITPGTFAKNALSITLHDQDAKIKNIKCNNKLRYKKTYRKYDDENDRVTYRFSFYTKEERRFKFKFTVDDQDYTVMINSTTPVAKATFADRELSTKMGLGTVNYVTDMTKGKFKVDMNPGYTLEAIYVGRYKNSKVGDATEPTLYWKATKNKKNITLSGERQVVESSDKEAYEESMYATTIVRVCYIYKDGSKGSIDYYFNRIVDADN